MIPYELQTVFGISVRNVLEILLGFVLNLQMAFGRMEDELASSGRAWSLDMVREG